MARKQANSVEYIRESDIRSIKLRTNKKGRTKKLVCKRRKGLLGTKEFFKHQQLKTVHSNSILKERNIIHEIYLIILTLASVNI